MGNNINLNDMINKAKNNGVELGQGTIIKKENKTKIQPGKLSPEMEKAFDTANEDYDKIIDELQNNPDGDMAKGYKKSVEFTKTGVLPSLDDIKKATGTFGTTTRKMFEPAIPGKDYSVPKDNIDLNEAINNLSKNVNLPDEPDQSEMLKHINVVTKDQVKFIEKEENVQKEQEEIIQPEEIIPPELPKIDLEVNTAELEPTMVELKDQQPVQNVVVIEKSGDGKIEFTEDEKAKLQESSIIHLKEVEEVEIPVFKTVKIVDDDKLDSILESVTEPFTATVALPFSGYSATFKSLSPGDIIDILYPASKDEIEQMKFKWTKIYKAIVNTSIGNLTYDQFIHHTASLDMEMCIFAILVATYGNEEHIIELTCYDDKHVDPTKKPEDEDYNPGYEFSVKSMYNELLRYDDFSDKLMEIFTDIADNSHILEDAKNYHQKKSLLMQVKHYKLPGDMYISLQIESIYDTVYRNAKSVMAMVTANANNAMYTTPARYIKDIIFTMKNGDKAKVESITGIVKILRTLPSDTLVEIIELSEKLVEGMEIKFGLKGISCPDCGRTFDFIRINLENELFTRVNQTKVKRID